MRTFLMQDGGTLVPDLEGKCPYCGKDVAVRWGSPPDDPGTLTHALPTCPTFDRMSGEDFVREVAKRSAAREPS